VELWAQAEFRGVRWTSFIKIYIGENEVGPIMGIYEDLSGNINIK